MSICLQRFTIYHYLYKLDMFGQTATTQCFHLRLVDVGPKAKKLMPYDKL